MSIEQILIDSGWTQDKIARVRLANNLIKRLAKYRQEDITNKTYGNVTVFEPIGFFDSKILWACQCLCGKPVLKTYEELKENYYPHCGCMKETAAYKLWERKRGKLHKLWRDNFERFYVECYIYRNENNPCREDKKYLNRKFLDRKLGPDNYFWSDSSEKDHQLFEKVVQILINNEGLTTEGAKDKVLVMSRKRKQRIIAAYEQKLLKDHNLRFMQKYGKAPPTDKKVVNSIILPTKALYSLSTLLEQSKYDENDIEFLVEGDKLLAKLKRLPKPIEFLPDTGEWDL